MTEAIGVFGLVAGVLQLVDTVAQIHVYIKDFRDAPKDQQRLLLEIQSLEPLAKELSKRIKRNQAAGSTSGLKEFEEPLVQLKGTMERLTKKLDSAGISKVSNRVMWPLWGKDEVEEGLNTAERFKSLLNAWLAMDIWKSGQDITSSIQDFAEEQRTDHSYITRSVKDLAKENKVAHNQTICTLKDATEEQRTDHIYIAKSIGDIVKNQERYHAPAERAEIIEWFSPLNFFLRQADILNTRQPRTGEWLLEDQLFKKWKSSMGNALWCRGMPGAGKTVLVSIVVHHLRATLETRNIGVAAIYLNHQETEAQSLSNLLAGLWRQLIVRKPISPVVSELYAKHREQRTRPSLEEIDFVLCSTIAELSGVFIIVDALDEYPQQQRSVLLAHLSCLAAGSAASLMFTSRPHISINHVAESLQILEIRATEDDIRRYIDAAVLKSSRLSKHIENRWALRDEIEEIIVRRSDGMFLLAKLHIDSLATKHTVKAVQEALIHMPRDLDSTYDEVVERINQQCEEDRQLAWRTLSWVTNAKRPLRPAELREALAVEQGTKQLDCDNLLDIDIILSVCAGLVVITEADKRIRLIHYTMQKYFEGAQAAAFLHASTEIPMTCFTYLSFDIFSHPLHDPMNLFRNYSFLDYAVEYCLTHARGEPEGRIKQSIMSFLADCGPWWQLWNWKHTKQPKSDARLWIASLFHLEEICRDLTQEDGQIYKATLDGLADLVELLINRGVDVNAKGVDGTALYIASGCGHYDVVRLLIEHGADVNIQGGPYGSALRAACSNGHLDVVQVLLEHGADITAQDGAHGSALQVASFWRHGSIVRLLIEHGAEIDAAGGWGGNALYAASLAGHWDMVNLLLEHGAKVNADEWCALHAASEAGHRHIVSLLIGHGADVNAPGKLWRSALDAARFKGHADIVKLLIKHGANPYPRGESTRGRWRLRRPSNLLMPRNKEI